MVSSGGAGNDGGRHRSGAGCSQEASSRLAKEAGWLLRSRSPAPPWLTLVLLGERSLLGDAGWRAPMEGSQEGVRLTQ